jgi:hypothetical protein
MIIVDLSTGAIAVAEMLQDNIINDRGGISQRWRLTYIDSDRIIISEGLYGPGIINRDDLKKWGELQPSRFP